MHLSCSRSPHHRRCCKTPRYPHPFWQRYWLHLKTTSAPSSPPSPNRPYFPKGSRLAATASSPTARPLRPAAEAAALVVVSRQAKLLRRDCARFTFISSRGAALPVLLKGVACA